MPPSPSRHRWSRLASTLAAGFLLTALGGVGVAWVADWRLVVVESASMEPTVPKNSLALVVPVARGAIRSGDVIRYREPADRHNAVLHRVVRVIEQRGELAFETQGDANNAPDGLLVADDDVTGRLRFHVPRLGSLATALASPGGFIFLSVVPLLALALSELAQVQRRRSETARSESSLVMLSP